MSKVVPFDRSADYMFKKALSNRKAGQLVDAAELLRRTIERDGENQQYLLELAALLNEMGCHTASNRELVRALSAQDPSNEIFYGMCCNFYGMSDTHSAMIAIRRHLMAEPEAAEREDVRSVLEGMLLSEALGEHADRRLARADRLAALGLKRLRENRLADAESALRRAIALNGRHAVAKAALCECLSKIGRFADAQEALSQLNTARRLPARAERSLLSAYATMGMADRTRELLARLDAEKRDPQDVSLLLEEMCRLGYHESVHSMAFRAFKQAPYDVRLLHILAASSINLGMPPETAEKYWIRIRRIDPDDTVASYYLDRLRAGTLQAPVPYTLDLPSEELEVRRRYVMHTLECNETAKDEKHFVRMARWLLHAETDERALSSLVLRLAALDNPEGGQLLREYLIDETSSADVKKHILRALMQRQEIFPAYASEEDAFLALFALDTKESSKSPLQLAKILREASAIAKSFCGDRTALLGKTWIAYLSSLKRRPRYVRHHREWSAALLLVARESEGAEDTPEEIAELCGCGRRLMNYCAERIREAQGDKEDKQ